MQTRAASVADVHVGTLADCLEPPKNLDITGIVFMFAHLSQPVSKKPRPIGTASTNGHFHPVYPGLWTPPLQLSQKLAMAHSQLMHIRRRINQNLNLPARNIRHSAVPVKLGRQKLTPDCRYVFEHSLPRRHRVVHKLLNNIPKLRTPGRTGLSTAGAHRFLNGL
jgi:hypothetical protein